MTEYPFAEKARMDPAKHPQTCAVCGEPIILRPMGGVMTFVFIDGEIRTLHGECDDR